MLKFITKRKDPRLFVERELQRVPKLGNLDQYRVNELEPTFLSKELGNHLASPVFFAEELFDEVCGRNGATVFGRTTQVLDAGFEIILKTFDDERILRSILPAVFFRVTSCRFLLGSIINDIEIDLHLANDDGRNLAQDVALIMEEASLTQSLGKDLLEHCGHPRRPIGHTKHGIFHAALFEIPEDLAAILERFLITMPD